MRHFTPLSLVLLGNEADPVEPTLGWVCKGDGEEGRVQAVRKQRSAEEAINGKRCANIFLQNEGRRREYSCYCHCTRSVTSSLNIGYVTKNSGHRRCWSETQWVTATGLDAPIYRTEPLLKTEESSPDKLAHSHISKTKKKKWSECCSEVHFELQYGVLLIYTWCCCT